MAVPYRDEPAAMEDVKAFALAESYFKMSKSDAWKDLLERLEGLVTEAQQDHFSSRETEPLKIVEEKLRWQQRLLTQQAILNIVQSQLDMRETLLEESKQGEADEHSTD